MADNIVSVGSTQNNQKKTKYHRDLNGFTTTYTFEGDLNEMSNLELQYGSNNWQTDLEQSDANVWELTATANYDTRKGDSPEAVEPQVIWNMGYQTENKDLLSLDTPVINLIPAVAIKAIQDALKANDENVLLNRLALFKITGDSYQAALHTYHHMAAGFRAWPVDVPVLQKSAYADYKWQINWSNANIGHVFQTSTLISQENVDARLIGVMPIETYNPDTNSDAFIPKVYGWRKGPVRSDLTNNNRYQITQHWTYGLWPSLFIPGYH